MQNLGKALSQVLAVMTVATITATGESSRGVKSHVPLDLQPSGIHRMMDEKRQRRNGVMIIKRIPLFVK